MSNSEKQSHRSSPSRNSSGSKTKRSKYEGTPSTTSSSKTKGAQSISKVKMPLPKEYQPIHTFIDDRIEMLDQMFITVQGDTLKGMLPDILKSCPLTELKKMCLDQLKLMSRKQILHILSGKDAASFSASSEDSDHENTKEEDSKPGNTISGYKRAAPTSNNQEDDSTDMSAKRQAKEISACSTPHSRSDGEGGAGGEALYLCAPQEEIDSLIQGETPHQLTTENPQPPPPPSLNEMSHEDKTLCSELEILELEMRARAIRSLMRAQGILSSDEEGDKPCSQAS